MISKVSVVITAHNRKKYLMDAVKSVLNQKKANSIVEVIVVKNFADQEIDTFLEMPNVKNIFTSEESFGRKLSTGIDAATGEIICFLDDDDMFRQDKISFIEKIFGENEDILFAHNNMVAVAEDATFTDDDGWKNDELSYASFSSEELPGRSWGKILSARADWYVSCISVKTEFARSISPVLFNSNRSLDKILFLLGAHSGSIFATTRNKITVYRKHESVTGLKMDPENFRQRKLNFTKESIKCINEACVASEYNVNKFALEFMLLKMNANLTIYERKGRVNSLKVLSRVIRHLAKYGGKEFALISLLLFINVLSNRLSLRIFKYTQTRDI